MSQLMSMPGPSLRSEFIHPDGRQEPHPHWSRLIVVSLTVSSN
jgi:hypothetical protein